MASTAAEGVELATARFSVDGMTCGGCVVATEMAVKRVEGVRSVTASLGEGGGPGSATVEYDPERTDTEAIAAAIRQAGFTPSLQRS
ncbi:MAG: heavy-metal-associated domain-containing protein [Gemmatimonadota bacterium]